MEPIMYQVQANRSLRTKIVVVCVWQMSQSYIGNLTVVNETSYDGAYSVLPRTQIPPHWVTHLLQHHTTRV